MRDFRYLSTNKLSLEISHFQVHSIGIPFETHNLVTQSKTWGHLNLFALFAFDAEQP